MSKTIREFSGQYRFLSNFWNCFVRYDGVTYPSVENAYQAAKMRNKKDRIRFKYIKSSEAKQLGKLLPMRKDWEQVKVTIMHELVDQKFKEPKLREMLLNTGKTKLEEGNWWGDMFWGTVNGQGKNHLGEILMLVRSEIDE